MFTLVIIGNARFIEARWELAQEKFLLSNGIDHRFSSKHVAHTTTEDSWRIIFES